MCRGSLCFQPEDRVQTPSRLIQRLPRFGVLVVRLGCQRNLTMAPFGCMSRSARQTGHSKQKRLASSICARVTGMTSVKGQPVFFRSRVALASPTGSRSGARLPTRWGVGLGVTCGKGNGAEAGWPNVPASLASDVGGELPGVGSVCSAFFGGCERSAWNFLALSLWWSATWRSPARASISKLRRLAGCGMVRVRISSVKLVPFWTKVAATASTSQSLSTLMQPTQPEAHQRQRESKAGTSTSSGIRSNKYFKAATKAVRSSLSST